MHKLSAILLVIACAAGCAAHKPAPAAPPAPADARALREPESITAPDRAARSRALFLEAARVFTHPRCLNCHPDGDTPAQGMEMTAHDPPVLRGPDDRGVVGMRCSGCHQDRNLELSRVPGAPSWHLAPRAMAWVGKSPRALCEQLRDPQRNGGKTLAQIAEHNGHDKLVGWGWNPGHGREPAPGTQEQLGRLVQAWIETGAECPDETARVARAEGAQR